MSTTGGLYSQTLQDITAIKLDELAKKRDGFESHRKRIAATVGEEVDELKKLTVLADGIKTCFSVTTDDGRVVRGSTDHPRLEIDLQNLGRFLAQARYDPTVSSSILTQWQQSLNRYLDLQSAKYAYASLYGQLTTEWLAVKRKAGTQRQGDDTEMEDFEHVDGGKKLESRKLWEQSVFEPTNVDVAAIQSMLRMIFEKTPNGSQHVVKALKKLRQGTKDFEQQLSGPWVFGTHEVTWTIKGLVNSDLLTEEKRSVLRDFMGNNAVLKEIADILNIRMAAIDTWSWGMEVPLAQRRQLNGTYNIYMDEDILQAIFCQFIGVKWSVHFKRVFSLFRKHRSVWKTSRSLVPLSAKKRRDYFLGPVEDGQSVVSKKQHMYRKDFFLARLLDSATQEVVNDEGDEEADFEVEAEQDEIPIGRALQSAMKSPMPMGQAMQMAGQAPGRGRATGTGGAKRHRKIHTSDADEDEDVDPEFDDDPSFSASKNPMEAKQSLLHLLSTEILIKTNLQGEITCFRSQIEDLFPSLPHATITTVLSYFGVSAKWIQFFSRFLEAPLRFEDDKTSEPRKRKQGTPASHVLSEMFSETVLFCLDFEVNRATDGEPLWRIGDDFWCWSSSHDACIKAWSNINTFAKTVGLSLNTSRTGGARMLRNKEKPEQLLSVEVGDKLPSGYIRWGMLRLNPESGRFEIDQDMVSRHVDELRRQLKSQDDSIFAYIKVWNTYANTFFTSNFGKPANCFGRQHVDDMLATHGRIQREVFSAFSSDQGATTSIVDYLKQTIATRFSVTDIPDGYIFLPTELGGLEVVSPFIGLLQLRDAVPERPQKILDDFFEAERQVYHDAKSDFDSGKTHKRYHASRDDPTFIPEDAKTFFSFEEFSKYREELSGGYTDELAEAFEKLMKRPDQQSIDADQNAEVPMALNALGRHEALRGITSNWYSMEPYWKWVAQLYGPELIERFGGFAVVDPGLLPMGMVEMFRSGRVRWRE